MANELELYERAVATLPGIERRGATMPYTSLNGHMFSYLDKDGTVALRLPAEARTAFIERYSSRLHQAHGIVQKEYVDVPPDLLADTAALQPHFAASLAYVASLKPKPTTRTKKA